MSDIFSVTWVSSCNAWTFKFHRHMIRFILTFLALVVGGIGGVATGVDVFQRRQTTGQVPPQCESLCNPINAMLAANCPPSQCCLATFETEYFNCFECVGSAANVTDYSEPQSIIDELYNQCAVAGFQLPVLIFPGQNSFQLLSSVVLPSTSQTMVSSSFITFAPSVIQPISPPSPTPTPATATQTSIPTPSLSSGTRSVDTSYFNLFKFAVAMPLGTWFYFAGMID